MKTYLTLIGLLLLFISCNKRESENKPYMLLNADLKRNYSFKEGSYWIYRDSLNGREDSFYVDHYSEKFSIEGQYSVQEVAATRIVQRNRSGGYVDSAVWELNLLNGTDMVLNYEHWPLGVFNFRVFLTNGYPFVYNNDLVKYPALNVRNVNYNNVAACRIRPYAFAGNDGWFYLKDSIGFLKMNFKLDTITYVWELERYHINH